MKKLVLLMLLAGCGDNGCAPVYESTMEACKKMCAPNATRSVTQSKCECQVVTK
jgi:hypothetical protein